MKVTCSAYIILCGVGDIYMRHFRLTVLVVLCAFIVCACSVTPFGKTPKNSDGSSESAAETTVASAVNSTDTPKYSELVPETTPSETEPSKPLTDEEALEGFENYLYFKIKNLQKILDEDKVPCTWGIATSSKNEIMIMFKSNTGALLRYHINRKSGKTYVTQYSVESNSYYRTRETLNVREYIDRKPTPTPYVIRPSGSTTPKPTPKMVIKVSNQVSKTAVIGGKKYPYKIPKVSITGKNTGAANRRMKSELGKFATKGANARAITYTYHVTDKLVSILVHIANHDTDSYDNYKAYNILISSGRLVKDSTVVKLYGFSSRKFISNAKDAYKAFGAGAPAPAETVKKCVNANVKRASYKYIDPFIARNGHLCFIGNVYFTGGAGKGNRLFDAYSRKPL